MGVHVESLLHRVVGLIEGTAFPHLDSPSVLSLLALVLAGAGLVTLRDVSLGGLDRLPLLVAEPFPRVEASIAVVAELPGVEGSLPPRLRRLAAHPSVDALVLAVTDPYAAVGRREIDGVPIRTALLTGGSAGPHAPELRRSV